MEIERVETDVLCVGGGIAALMAAIRAGELGAKVVVADKGNTLTSGAGGAGNDHFIAYIPEVHGDDVTMAIRSVLRGQLGGSIRMLGPAQTIKWFNKTSDIVRLWNEWGIPMKPFGEWRFAGHCFPGQMNCALKYYGKNQKEVLTRQARRAGAKIMNRTMVIELLGDTNGVTGALAADTREEKLIEFRAKSVVLATGRINRILPGPRPLMMNNDPLPINLTGDGRAMAYRLGAALTNLEFIVRQIGIKNFLRAGQGSWIGVYRDPSGKPIGKYVSEPDVDCGDILPEVNKDIFIDMIQSGRGPVYMDCRGISDEDAEFMEHSLIHEGNEALVNYFKEEGIDLKRNPVEFDMNVHAMGASVYRDENAETSVKGLYAAGDEATRSISCAAIFGWFAGENAAEYAGETTPSQDVNRTKALIEEKANLIEGIKKRRQGYDWKDANIALQQTMEDYAGFIRSKDMLNAGLAHLRRLKEKVDTSLVAENRWELTRCLEVLNLYTIGELVLLAALERKESRGDHKRVDYAYTDPLLDGKLQFIKKVNGEPVSEWYKLPHAP